MHWSLDQVRDLDEDEFTELCGWLKERAARANGDEASIDMDEVTAAAAKRRHTDGQ